MTPIMLSLDPQDAALATALLDSPDLKAKKVERDRITGGSELINVVLVLTPVALTALVKILHEKWTTHTRVKIQSGGIKVEGITTDQVEGVLRQILEHQRASKP